MPVALVVEDEWLVRMEIADALQASGWDVIEASTGEAAVALLERNLYIDLLLTDIRLPGPISGWDIAEAFRAANGGIAVIYCSGNPPDPSCQVAGSVFLSKPCRSELLVEIGAKLCTETGEDT